MSSIQAKSVSWLVRRIGSGLDSEPSLHGVVIEGEVSNFHAHSSGHWYFSLKDDHARIDCTMWESDNLLVNFGPANGDRVKVLGNVTIYAVQGKVQLTVRRMARAGEGDLKARFDALYKKLDEEGLFSPDHKIPIPSYAMRIGLVTGNSTHARADVLQTLGRRWPVAEIVEFPSLVQGEAAPAELIKALTTADQEHLDVILLCRGGGSMEDLWCFNDEVLVRTIYAMKTPVITGVGHEPDWTMVDYVADLRAPTPTGAAERAAPDQKQVLQDLKEKAAQLNSLMNRTLHDSRERLDMITSSEWYRNPGSLSEQRRLKKDLLEHRFLHHLSSLSFEQRHHLEDAATSMSHALERSLTEASLTLETANNKLNQTASLTLERTRQQLMKQAGLLDAYSPLKVLSRGYSVVYRQQNVITESRDLQEGDSITIRMHKGTLDARVEQVHKEEDA